MKKTSLLLCLSYLLYTYNASSQINSQFSDTTISVSGIKVDLLFPVGQPKGYILVLPGWNFPTNDCCLKSDFCSKARQKGYCLIMPDMRKSVYQTEDYKETRADWRIYPTRTWLTDTLIPFVQKRFEVLKPGQKNYLFGISTGARGVALLAIHTDSIFVAGAALSGDYNQIDMPDDNLMKGYYGNYQDFKNRWLGLDNPFMNADRIKIPLYLGHGNQDKIVPVNQTINFFEKLKGISPVSQHQLHISENNGHDYQYWNSEVDNVLRFFENH
jgi:S-formylglutathione hydrolase FrmB